MYKCYMLKKTIKHTKKNPIRTRTTTKLNQVIEIDKDVLVNNSKYLDSLIQLINEDTVKIIKENILEIKKEISKEEDIEENEDIKKSINYIKEYIKEYLNNNLKKDDIEDEDNQNLLYITEKINNIRNKLNNSEFIYVLNFLESILNDNEIQNIFRDNILNIKKRYLQSKELDQENIKKVIEEIITHLKSTDKDNIESIKIYIDFYILKNKKFIKIKSERDSRKELLEKAYNYLNYIKNNFSKTKDDKITNYNERKSFIEKNILELINKESFKQFRPSNTNNIISIINEIKIYLNTTILKNENTEYELKQITDIVYYIENNIYNKLYNIITLKHSSRYKLLANIFNGLNKIKKLYNENTNDNEKTNIIKTNILNIQNLLDIKIKSNEEDIGKSIDNIVKYLDETNQYKNTVDELNQITDIVNNIYKEINNIKQNRISRDNLLKKACDNLGNLIDGYNNPEIQKIIKIRILDIQKSLDISIQSEDIDIKNLIDIIIKHLNENIPKNIDTVDELNQITIIEKKINDIYEETQKIYLNQNSEEAEKKRENQAEQKRQEEEEAKKRQEEALMARIKNGSPPPLLNEFSFGGKTKKTKKSKKTKKTNNRKKTNKTNRKRI